MTDEQTLDDIVSKIREEASWIRDPLVISGLQPDDSPNDIAWTPPATWNVWALGYKLAAESVAAAVRGAFKADFAVYPLVSLYRHSIELKLKAICITANRFTDMSYETRVKKLKGHKLSSLWDSAVELSRAAGLDLRDSSQVDLGAFHTRLKELEELSPTGQEARYPILTTGEPSWQNVDYLNLRQFRKTMTGIWHLLEGIEGELESRAEIYEEFYRY